MTAALKNAVCALLARLPPVCWPLAGRVVRAAWAGFRDA
jgi:hypothetical protein